MRSNAVGDNQAQLGARPLRKGGCLLVTTTLARHAVDRP